MKNTKSGGNIEKDSEKRHTLGVGSFGKDSAKRHTKVVGNRKQFMEQDAQKGMETLEMIQEKYIYWLLEIGKNSGTRHKKSVGNIEKDSGKRHAYKGCWEHWKGFRKKTC